MPKITIITPTFNSEKTLDRTVSALLRQSISDFEYIVVDGASTDKTIEKIEAYIPLFKEKGVSVRLISEPDKGVYDAMNKGIALAQGELVGITNSDDWYEDNALEVMWNKFADGKTDRSNSILYGIERVWLDNKVFNIQRRGASFVASSVLPHSTFFVANEVYKKHGAFDLSIRVLSDYDFTCRCVIKKGVVLEEVDVIVSNFCLGGISSSYFDYYSDFYRVKHKYGLLSNNKYRKLKMILGLRKMLNKVPD